ncbi:MAG: AMP-binding protein [Bacteroidota bacterium]
MSHPRPGYRAHAPLLTEAGDVLLRRMEQHPAAPRWNYTCGDRLVAADLPVLDAMRADLAAEPASGPGEIPETVVARLLRERARVPHLAAHLPETASEIVRTWADLPTLSREDLVRRTPAFVPDAADLDRMVIYSTSGTTGHPILIPNHPVGASAYQLLLERAFALWDVPWRPEPNRMANALVCAQAETIQHASVLTVWGGAGHVKVNLDPAGWREAAHAPAYLEAFDPPLLTGDPLSFATLLDLDADLHPEALVSTAVSLSDGLRRRLGERFGCPVFEWYSMNEVGPIAVLCPAGQGHHVLDPTVYVEVVDADGRPCPPGVRGEVTVTGGRNPMLRLLRYRTGDTASMAYGPCPCGSSAPRLVDLEGRRPVEFRSASGGLVNPVDVSRVLRAYPLAQHRLVQRADRACTLDLRVAGPVRPEAVATDLRALFGDVPLEVRLVDGPEADEKWIPFVSEIDQIDHARD